MAKSILLTGATGFLGSHLLEAFLNEGYEVVVLKRSASDTWRIAHLAQGFKSYDVDIEPIEKVFKEQHIDVVVHTATFYRKLDNLREIPEMVASNITFPLQVVEYGLKNDLKAFINTGTFFEYDCSTLPVSEDAQYKPFNLYAKTKIAFESLIATYSNLIAVKTLRLFSPYGEKDNEKLIPILIKKALKSEPVELSDNSKKLDFIYVLDIVSAYLKAVETAVKEDRGYRIYNIGSGIGVSVQEVVSILEGKIGVPIKKIWNPLTNSDIQTVFADISRAKKELGWKPRFNLNDGLERTLNYYRESKANDRFTDKS